VFTLVQRLQCNVFSDNLFKIAPKIQRIFSYSAASSAKT